MSKKKLQEKLRKLEELGYIKKTTEDQALIDLDQLQEKVQRERKQIDNCLQEVAKDNIVINLSNIEFKF